jgi:hypothetical protein
LKTLELSQHIKKTSAIEHFLVAAHPLALRLFLTVLLINSRNLGTCVLDLSTHHAALPVCKSFSGIFHNVLYLLPGKKQSP